MNDTDLFVDTDGSELMAVNGALQRRPTIVVLHGGPGFDQGYLRPGMHPLAEDAQLLFVDLRRQGRSGPAPVQSCTLEQMADDVAELCRLLGLRRPVIFGHSAGGFVALHVAVRHPGLAAGLILCNTAATLGTESVGTASPPGPFERGGPQAAAAASRLFGGDFSAAAGEEFNRLVLPLYAAPGREELPARLMSLSKLDPDIAAHFFRRLAASYDVRSQLGRITVPTLVVTGRLDWVCPPAAGRTLAALIPTAHLVELDTGHFAPSEAPEAFQQAVRGHLDDLHRRRSRATSAGAGR